MIQYLLAQDPITLWAILKLLIVNMAWAYGLSYLGGLLFGQDLKEAEDEPKGQSFAWRPHTTHQEGIPRPECFGRNQHYGNVVMRWTDVDPVSGNEILFKALDYGQGPIQGVTGGILSDKNNCLGGAPAFNKISWDYVNTWYQTAANINDDDKATYVGFYHPKEGSDHLQKGGFDSIVTFDSATIDRVEYRRHWYIKGEVVHSGWEKISLYYAAGWHLIATKSITTEGTRTGTVVVEAGGPWEGVTKVKIEVELQAKGYWVGGRRNYSGVRYHLHELRAWRLEDLPVFLNGQPAHNFTEAIIRGRPGTLNQTCMLGFEKNKLQYAPETVIAYDEPVRWTTPNKFGDDIEFTLAWLRGLYYYSDGGGIKTHGVGVKVEISERDADDWSTVLETTIYASQLRQYYKAYSVNTEEPGSVVYGTQYDMKFSKTTGDKSPSRHGDEMQLRSVREVVETEFTHPGRALLGVIVEATERLQGHVDIKWVADGKLIPVYDSEGNYTIEFTRNRAMIDLAIRTQPVISGDGDVNPWVLESYEGIDPSRVDLAKWYEWAQFCDALVPSGVGAETEKRMSCDIICDQLTNVWSIAYEIAQIGRMYPYWQGHTLTGWMDKTTTESIDLITMDNTMARSWKSSYAGYGEMAGSVKVFYKDAQQGYARKPRPVHNPNAGLYARIIMLEGVGVTAESLATRVGNHALKRNELIKNVNSVRMGREALRYKLGRVVRIAANRPNQGQSYRVITSPTASTCELDRVIVDVVENDLIWVKTYDTINKEVSLDSYTVDSVAGKVVTIKQTWVAGCTPLRNHYVAIGVTGSVKERRIIKMNAVENNYFDVTLETYDTVLFNSDDVDPVLTNPDFVQPVTEISQPMTRQAVVDIINELTAPAPKVMKPQLFNCALTGDDVDTVTWSKQNPDEPILLIREGVTHVIAPDSTTDEYIYWDIADSLVFSTTNDPAVALAVGVLLVCTNKDGVASPAVFGQTADATITTPKIVDNAVTLPMSGYTEAGIWIDGANWTTLQEITFPSTGEKLFLNWSCRMLRIAGDALHPYIRVMRDAVEIYYSGQQGESSNRHYAGSVEDEPGSGEYTYYLKGKLNEVGAVNRYKGSYNFLYIHELKK